MSARVATSPATLWLSCHVQYACAHSGACCRSGWPLPVDARVVPLIDAAVSQGRVRTIDGNPRWLDESTEAPHGTPGLFRLAAQACVFHVPRGVAAASHGDDSRHCGVHAALGHEALPASCQHFPRVCLIDGRGVRVTLSHYCPTAAAMLFDHDGPVEIVRGPDAVPGIFAPEGLDARDELPPRLTRGLLMDLDALSAWERLLVQTLAGPGAPDGTPADALTTLRGYAEQLSLWTPGSDTSLTDAIGALRAGDAAPDGFSGKAPRADRGFDGGPYRLERQRRAMRLTAAACRPPWTWPAVPADLDDVDREFVALQWPTFGPLVRRYLAAKAFGAWMTYQADATRALVRWLQLAHDVLRVEAGRACGAARRPLDRNLLLAAVRQSDLLLLHYADSLAVARAL